MESWILQEEEHSGRKSNRCRDPEGRLSSEECCASSAITSREWELEVGKKMWDRSWKALDIFKMCWEEYGRLYGE